MKQLNLTTFIGSWETVLDEIERSDEPVALYWGERPCGVLLPASEAERVLRRIDDHTRARGEQRQAAAPVASSPAVLPTYLDLLRDDPTLVPVLDGQPLQFMTMSNTSFVDPQQMYTFMDPRDGVSHVFRADELQQAIGRRFAKVEFIPPSPRDYVAGRRSKVQGPRSPHETE